MHTHVVPVLIFSFFGFVENKFIDLYEICDQNYAKRVYLEYGEGGRLVADTTNKSHIYSNHNFGDHKKCSVEFITCPSCVVHIKFRYLNISRTCGKTTVFDSCGCDYVWIYEPPFEEISGEQFCGRLIDNSTNKLEYISQTKNVAVTFLYSREYGHAFTVEFHSERNRLVYYGFPKLTNMNNGSQSLSSPFFPYYYPSDLSVEYVIRCESTETCRISLIFSDFQLAPSSIIEFFDWNGQRMFVSDGEIFRPPVIVSSGPSLTIRFYANGAFSYGFKASYSFLLGNFNDLTFKPDIGCGGNVNNLGGGITMMNMMQEGTKYFDCVWIITPPPTSFHLKTHLYVKVIKFSDFAGTTELTIHQGLTSNEPIVESIKQSLSFFGSAKQKEHVVPIKQGFYLSLKGLFRPESRLAIVYAAFNYKDCYAGSDFLCNNFRCISALLNCDGFDHCGDNSDEAISCSENPKDRRYRSNTPNFLFPKVEQYSDVSTATMIFLICGFGLIGIILALALLLYRVNIRAHHHRRIQDHIETIHAILEEGVVEVEEEIIIPDDPPDYEAPPEYSDWMKKGSIIKKKKKIVKRDPSPDRSDTSSSNGTKTVPSSPPPPYSGGNSCFELPTSSENNENYPDPVEGPSQPKYIKNTWINWQEKIRQSFQYYKSKTYMNMVKSSSDTELNYLGFQRNVEDYWPQIKRENLPGKSFSHDDITNLLK